MTVAPATAEHAGFRSFPVRSYPPPATVPAAGTDGSRGWGWFPLRLLLEELGHCGCGAPALYVAADTGALGASALACMAACEDHACNLAALVNNHTRCPKCHVRWSGPDAETAPGFDHVAPGAAI